MKKVLFLLIAVSLVFVSCASAPKKDGETQGNDPQVSDNAEEKYDKMLVEAEQFIRDGKREEAIEKKIDPVIAYYSKKYEGSSEVVFCARTKEEAGAYIALRIADGVNITVEGTTWSDAFFYKAYVLVELKKFDEAKKYIEKALELSPYNATYLAELGHIYQLEKNWDKTLEIFKNAVKYAEEYTPAEIRDAEVARGLRGVGYTLIELGQLDEAEKLYVECLKINNNDRTAIQELMYIKKLRDAKKEKPQEDEQPKEEEKPAKDEEPKA